MGRTFPWMYSANCSHIHLCIFILNRFLLRDTDNSSLMLRRVSRDPFMFHKDDKMNFCDRNRQRHSRHDRIHSQLIQVCSIPTVNRRKYSATINLPYIFSATPREQHHLLSIEKHPVGVTWCAMGLRTHMYDFSMCPDWTASFETR